MKALLVTSAVTFVPRNYADALEAVLDRAAPHVAGLVVLELPRSELLAHVAKAAAAGFPRLAWQLWRNLDDDRAGRRERSFAARGLPVWRAPTMNDPRVIALVAELGVDVVVNMRTRCRYREAILAAPRLACINVHHGLLPEHRGLMCDLRALAERRAAGFTIHVMTKKIDDGAILRREVVHDPARDGDRSDYLGYLDGTGAIEGAAVARLLLDIAARGGLPPATPNRCPAARMERALDWRAALALHAAGMKL